MELKTEGALTETQNVIFLHKMIKMLIKFHSLKEKSLLNNITKINTFITSTMNEINLQTLWTDTESVTKVTNIHF
jgi:hypothetical protein